MNFRFKENMEYTLQDKNGKVKRYEVSYSQVLQRQTNKLLTILIILLLILLAAGAYTLLKVDLMDIPTRLIYG
jgi:hypothetical protein